jgi:hypothetical protein
MCPIPPCAIGTSNLSRSSNPASHHKIADWRLKDSAPPVRQGILAFPSANSRAGHIVHARIEPKVS